MNENGRNASLRPLALVAALALAGCASQPSPVDVQPPAPVEARQPERVAPTVTPAAPDAFELPLPTAPATPPLPRPQKAADLQGRVAKLLPPSLKTDRKGWAADIAAAFATLRLAPSDGNLCSAIAVIEQESGFQADPVVPGLARIAKQEIETRRKRYGIPKLALDAALAKKSLNGQTYQRRLDTLKTERQMSMLFDDMIGELPGGQLLLSGYNPVRTGGPMQVSIAYAEQHAQDTPYPGAGEGGVRKAVFTRRGGVHFGIAHLLDYPAAYRDPIYRYADFNAGHYASRNVAFQQAVARLTGRKLALDGDLLRYQNGRPSAQSSATRNAVLALAPRLRLSEGEIDAGLQREKSADFADSAVYRRVFALADRAAGKFVAREAMPRIDLQSPKIQRKLTTEWFATRVKMRYGQCMQRAAGA